MGWSSSGVIPRGSRCRVKHGRALEVCIDFVKAVELVESDGERGGDSSGSVDLDRERLHHKL